MPKEPKIIGLFYDESVYDSVKCWVVSYDNAEVAFAWVSPVTALTYLKEKGTHHSKWFPNPQLAIPGELL